jgi:hypothetical protein
VSSSEQPQDASAEPEETVLSAATVTVHRAPRYRNFMLLGAIVGVLLAFILTLAFEQNAEYAQAQVFGFLLLGGIAVCTTLGAVVALIIDRFVGRAHVSVVADRLGRNDRSVNKLRTPEPGSGTPNDDFQAFNEK